MAAITLCIIGVLSCKNKKQESAAHFDKGNDLLFKGDNAGAKKEYQQALAIWNAKK